MQQTEPHIPRRALHTRCSQCGTEHVLDPQAPPAPGAQATCSRCATLFTMVAFEVEPPPRDVSGAPQWLVRRLDGAVYEAPQIGVLQRWIGEGRVSRDDLLSVRGGSWQRLGNLLEFATLFAAAPAPAPAAADQATPQPRLTPAGVAHSRVAEMGAPQVVRRPTRRRTTEDALFALEAAPVDDGFATRPRPTRRLAAQRRARLRLILSLGLIAVAAATWVALDPEGPARLRAWVVQGPDQAAVATQLQLGYQQLDQDTAESIAAAERTFAAAVALDDGSADAHSALAEAALVRAETAAWSLADAAAAPPPQDSLQRHMATLQQEGDEAAMAHQMAIAQMELEQALRLAPQSLAANRAQAEFDRLTRGPWERAAPSLQRARAVAPADVRLRAIEAQKLAETDVAGAAAALRELYAQAPTMRRLGARLARLEARRAAAVGGS